VDERVIGGTLAVARVAVGIAFVGAPRLAVRAWSGAEAGPALRMAARALGARDLALGVGVLRALREDAPLADWLAAGALADASDALGTVLSFRSLPRARRVLVLVVASGSAIVGARVAGALR
jgi:hypothetical protein